MTERAKINRPISASEIAVIQTALDRAAVAPEFKALGQVVPTLRAVDRCTCGCDSVDFVPYDQQLPAQPVANALGTTRNGGIVGVIVWGRADTVTGLEVYDLGAGDDDLRLPTVDSIRPFDEGAA